MYVRLEAYRNYACHATTFNFYSLYSFIHSFLTYVVQRKYLVGCSRNYKKDVLDFYQSIIEIDKRKTRSIFAMHGIDVVQRN